MNIDEETVKRLAPQIIGALIEAKLLVEIGRPHYCGGIVLHGTNKCTGCHVRMGEDIYRSLPGAVHAFITEV